MKSKKFQKDNIDKKWIGDLLDEQSFIEEENLSLDRNNTDLPEPSVERHPAYKGHFNPTQDWKLLKNRLRPEDRSKVIRLYPTILRYAAILAFPVLIGTVYFLLNRDHPKDELAVQKTTSQNEPSSNKVMLVLDNGKKIQLSGAKDSILLHNNVISSEGKIDYSQSNTMLASFNTLIVPRGADYTLILDDGTKVWLNADTRIRYQTNFDQSLTREVYLESGEAYFKVTKNPAKPFIVHNDEMNIRVLGTSFNVNAYRDLIQTTLEEGKVNIDLNNKQGQLTLEPGQQSGFDKNSGSLTKHNVDVYPFVAWKDGVLAWENTTLEDIMQQLGRLYDYNVVFESEQLKHLHYYGSTDKASTIKPLLEIIENTAHVKFEINDRTITVKKDN